MAIFYEWDVELVEEYEDGDNDIHDHFHQLTFADCLKQAAQEPQAGCRWDVVLVCNDNQGRSWAYLEGGKLPEHFMDAYDTPTRKVPQRFHNEVARAAER